MIYITKKVKGKGEVLPVKRHEGTKGKKGHNSTLSLTSALNRGLVVNTMPKVALPPR
jgi:hypothetical protein